MTYQLPQCNCRSHFLLFHHNQAGSMQLEIWMNDDNNDTKVRIVAEDESYRTFERMTYHLQCNSDSQFLHFHICQDNCMLEIWMNDDNNDTKVRIVVADQSYPQRMTYLHTHYNSDRSHFLHIQHHQAPRMLEIWMDRDNDAKVRLVQWTVDVAFDSTSYPVSLYRSCR